jgi:hypothetical protein
MYAHLNLHIKSHDQNHKGSHKPKGIPRRGGCKYVGAYRVQIQFCFFMIVSTYLKAVIYEVGIYLI